MSIPELQLESWSHQGSIAQSSATYSAIKNTLEASATPYVDKSYKVSLQGSYGNDTNIYSESDVDIVIQLNDCFQYDVSNLPDDQKTLFHSAHPTNATYTHVDFKRDVLSVLKDAYDTDVNPCDKAIKIVENANRRNADVIAAVQFRRYYKFNSINDQSYDEGICFYDSAGQQIANYPKQHSENLTRKHKETSQWFKPMARVFKNMRGKLIDDKMITSGVAPSYYLEGLLYNVPVDKFGTSYAETFVNCINWIQKADKSKFVCANEQYYLLRENCPVTWQTAKCDEYLSAVIKLWNNWA
ncbi:MAG: nucleotidyltransferase [Candidatus Omnitrophota bacterium]